MNIHESIARRKQNEMNRRNVLLREYFQKFVDETYASYQTHIYVESIDEYLFHVVIDMKLSNASQRHNVDSFVIRFKTYDNDEFVQLSKIYS